MTMIVVIGIIIASSSTSATSFAMGTAGIAGGPAAAGDLTRPTWLARVQLIRPRLLQTQTRATAANAASVELREAIRKIASTARREPRPR